MSGPLRTAREGLAAAVRAAVAEQLPARGWHVYDRVPETPDDLLAWVRWPGLTRRADMSGNLDMELAVTFCVSLSDPDQAQDIIDELYDDDLWDAIERYSPTPRPWRAFAVEEMAETENLAPADGSVYLTVDLVCRVITAKPPA